MFHCVKSIQNILAGRVTSTKLLVVLAVLLMVTGCGGGLSRNDAALFSKALGEELRLQNYSKIGGPYVPKQEALADQSGLSSADVAELMSKVQDSLLSNFAVDSDFKLAGDLLEAVNTSDELTNQAAKQLDRWLLRQDQNQVQAVLAEFLRTASQQHMEEMLKAVAESGLDYGFFAGAGTFWFRNAETREYITVTFADYTGDQLVIVMEGVAQSKAHPLWNSALYFDLAIDQVSMWRDTQEAPPATGKAKCCQKLTSVSNTRLEVVTSLNPNNLFVDPPGYGSAAYIAENQGINFTIRFDIPAESSAPASDITVIAQLSEGFDLTSLLLGQSSHPEVMTTEINDSNGTITWSFENIMLPHNQTRPEGEGWIRFSAQPRGDVLSGEVISAKAAIRFDFNPAIETNEVVYTIDAGSPDSQVVDLTAVQLSPNVQVPWSGSDDRSGSGIQGVTLLVSEDGAPLEVVGTFTEPLIPFQAEPGKSYGFTTVSVDNVGHVEPLAESFDATVTVGQHLGMEPGWHLVGVPAATYQSPRDELVRPGTQWSTWDTSNQSYQSDAADARWLAHSQELPGAGLWANFEEGTNFYVTGDAPPVDRPFAIELAEGWNLIANPFPLPVVWSLDDIKVRSAGVELDLAQAQVQGWLEDFAWGWDGESYSLVYDSNLSTGSSSTLEPFKGYWVQAHDDVTLVLPPPTLSRD